MGTKIDRPSPRATVFSGLRAWRVIELGIDAINSITRSRSR
jgi:hypothetical protein